MSRFAKRVLLHVEHAITRVSRNMLLMKMIATIVALGVIPRSQDQRD